MSILLLIICIILVFCLIYEKQKARTSKKEISYIIEKLNAIMETDTQETIKLMTDEEQIRELLMTLNRVLEYNHANQMKYHQSRQSMKKMLSNISHDLKTPLTVVLGYLEMLELQNPENECVCKAHLRTQEVIQLINQFFDLAKLESGDKEIVLSRVNICELCRLFLIEDYQALEAGELNVEIEIPEKPVYVMANEDAMKRILNNLISNAVKYGAEGKYLGFRITETEEHAEIQVIDHGRGIEEQHKEEIFERMYTLEDSRSKKYQGSGLGLTITKELVEAQGGEIHLVSKPFQSTIFSVLLPKLSF